MFSVKLKELRKEKGITQQELAKILGVERSTISKYEGKDNVMPSHEVLFAIAAYFGVSADYLLDLPKPAALPFQNELPEGFSTFEVSDDSMEPKFSVGDIAIVKKDADINTNDYVLVTINETPTIKKIKTDKDCLMLIPTNPKYDVLFYNNMITDTSEVKILGKVVELRSKF
ncbi:MAG: LexA family transcriptional regulator [Clostridia bacterium]|nr:LexA family transcriptional regulator [Clostridia bacterium]